MHLAMLLLMNHLLFGRVIDEGDEVVRWYLVGYMVCT
jgi:hypothetical protein